MGISNFLRDIESEDGMVSITRQQADDISNELDKVIALLSGMVKLFKREADIYFIKTRYRKPYRDAKDYLKSLGGDNDNT